jgi:PSP1 C-terminal conserved region
MKQYTHSGYDDDLTHPLAGEDIDDPGDDLVYGNQSPVFSMPYQLHKGSTYLHDGNSFSRSLPQTAPARNPVETFVNSTHHSIQSSPRLVYAIKFKRTQRSFIPGPRVVGDLKIGCYVKVEADRGEDLGIVMNKMTMDKFCSVGGRTGFRVTGSAAIGNDMGMLPASNPINLADLKHVIRLATQDEVSLLSAKRGEEEELLRICREKVEQRALPMYVVDAEYQFDRNKLTFFFEAESRIDFRELVRDLFSIYKTRIWMQQLDKNSNNSASGSPRIVSPNVDYASTQQQIPIMADSIHDPYGIAQNEFGGAR